VADTQLSDAERLAIAREPGNEKLLAEEQERLRDLRWKLEDGQVELVLARTRLNLLALRCDAGFAPIADAIDTLLQQRQQFDDESGGAEVPSFEVQESFEYKAELAARAIDAMKFLRKRLYGPVTADVL
jgi:hypothetical protein